MENLIRYLDFLCDTMLLLVGLWLLDHLMVLDEEQSRRDPDSEGKTIEEVFGLKT